LLCAAVADKHLSAEQRVACQTEDMSTDGGCLLSTAGQDPKLQQQSAGSLYQ